MRIAWAIVLSIASGVGCASVLRAGELAALPNNSAVDLGAYTCTTAPGDQSCRRVTEYSGFTYDPLRHQMLMFGGGHSTTFRDDVDVFSVESLTWQSAYPTTPCAAMTAPNFDPTDGKWISTGHPTSRHSYDLLVVAETTGELIVLRGGDGPGSQCTGFNTGGGRIAHYQVGTNPAVWTFGADPVWQSSSPQDFYPSAEYDPLSGRIVVVGTYGLSTYDPATRVALRHVVDAVGERGYANNLVYFPPNQKMYLIARGAPTRVFEVTLDRALWSNSTIVELLDTTGAIPDSQESGWAYDAVNHIIGGGIRDGRFYAFDPTTRVWVERVIEVIGPSGPVGTVAYHALDYAPGENVFIFLSSSDGGAGDRTWAYRFLGAPFFSDGFESGDTAGWSSSYPPP